MLTHDTSVYLAGPPGSPNGNWRAGLCCNPDEFKLACELMERDGAKAEFYLPSGAVRMPDLSGHLFRYNVAGPFCESMDLRIAAMKRADIIFAWFDPSGGYPLVEAGAALALDKPLWAAIDARCREGERLRQISHYLQDSGIKPMYVHGPGPEPAASPGQAQLSAFARFFRLRVSAAFFLDNQVDTGALHLRKDGTEEDFPF